MSVHIYLPQSLRKFEPKYIAFSTWMEHLAFGYDIVAAVRPKLLVELGTHQALSYFTFCQSMKEHGIDGICYAVDTWVGDKHTDTYDESVYDRVTFYNHENYHGFSYLLRMLFNDALRHFSDAAIDLLHLDGLHTYEAVSEDFKNWYPKVKPGGIMLFHDVCARIKDFGAWKFWEETSVEHETFTFNHGFGLGVLRKPGGPVSKEPLMELLFDSDENGREELRALYVHASKHLELQRKVKRANLGPAKALSEKKEDPG